jgi:hypothetical protein
MPAMIRFYDVYDGNSRENRSQARYDPGQTSIRDSSGGTGGADP